AEGAGDAPDTRAGRRARWQREPAAARDIMTKNPRAVRRGAGIREIAQIMRDEGTGIVPVVEESGQLLGVVTDRDIVMRALAEGRNPLELTASDVMTDDVEAVTPEESLRGVVDLMGNKQIRRVPVVDQNDRLVGIISMGDVATRADYDEDLQDALEEISARRSFWSGIFG
ncbi:MAG: CBS domain-containing protein, partial [Gemmatimonadaceae bacterium]